MTVYLVYWRRSSGNPEICLSREAAERCIVALEAENPHMAGEFLIQEKQTWG